MEGAPNESHDARKLKQEAIRRLVAASLLQQGFHVAETDAFEELAEQTSHLLEGLALLTTQYAFQSHRGQPNIRDAVSALRDQGIPLFSDPQPEDEESDEDEVRTRNGLDVVLKEYNEWRTLEDDLPINFELVTPPPTKSKLASDFTPLSSDEEDDIPSAGPSKRQKRDETHRRRARSSSIAPDFFPALPAMHTWRTTGSRPSRGDRPSKPGPGPTVTNKAQSHRHLLSSQIETNRLVETSLRRLMKRTELASNKVRKGPADIKGRGKMEGVGGSFLGGRMTVGSSDLDNVAGMDDLDDGGVDLDTNVGVVNYERDWYGDRSMKGRGGQDSIGNALGVMGRGAGGTKRRVWKVS